MISQATRPHYLLITDAGGRQRAGRWRFVVRPLDGGEETEIADFEADVLGDRLDLLTVIRGLESLDQPSRVTLVTSSRYVKQGIDQGLASWRDNDWTWERFGERVEIKHCDLWRRLDRALSIHEVQCRRWRADGAHDVPAPHGAASRAVPTPAFQKRSAATARSSAAPTQPRRSTGNAGRRLGASRPLQQGRRLALRFERWLAERFQAWRLRVAECGSHWLPAPWLDDRKRV